MLLGHYPLTWQYCTPHKSPAAPDFTVIRCNSFNMLHCNMLHCCVLTHCCPPCLNSNARLKLINTPALIVISIIILTRQRKDIWRRWSVWHFGADPERPLSLGHTAVWCTESKDSVYKYIYQKYNTKTNRYMTILIWHTDSVVDILPSSFLF